MLSRVPFVGVVIFFMTGILLNGYLIPESTITHIILTAIIIIAGAGSIFLYSKKTNLYTGIAFAFFILTGGILSAVLQNNQLRSEETALTGIEYSSYEAIVKSLPEKRAKSIRIEAVITRIQQKDQWVKQDIKALISIPIDASSIPKPGDYLIVSGNVERPVKSLNPEEFDYQRYLWNKGIVWTDYLPDGSYHILTSGSQSFSPGLWSSFVSEWADRKFRDNIKNDRSYGLVKAMLLGRRDDLRSDQVDDYTTSGTVHILSVSGMHVAIIFLVISMSLSWLKRWRIGKYIYLIAVTSLLCFYALVTGLPPSVQRATLMCIVFIAAEAFSRKQSSMNTLAISALLILIIDPHALYDVGFQLSFLAMAGIFLLYVPITLIWDPSNPVLKYIWQITAMSFAAQLATFPLSLFYFHQFPFYFWLINPFVIFFTNFLLPAAMVQLVVSLFNIEWLQFVANFWVETSAYLTNISVSLPKLLPGYLIENLYLDRFEVVLLYVFIFTVWYSYYKQEYLFLKRSAVIAVLFVFYSTSKSVQTYLTSAAIIHVVSKHSVISFKEGNRLFISGDEAFESDTNAYKFHIKNYAISQGISETVYLSNQQNLVFNNLITRNLPNGKLISWKGIIINHGEYVDSAAPVDYNLITGGNFSTQNDTLTNLKTTFLLGGEIRGKKREKLTAYLAGQHRKFYDLGEGFLLLH